MAETTGIEWCDATFNPWMGCTRVSPACDDCYAARSTPARTLGIEWGAGQPRRRTSASNWAAPKAWAKTMPARLGRRPRVFCASLADWLDNEVPIEWLVDLLDLIRQTPGLDWLLLSKRIGNWRKRMEDAATRRLAELLADGGDPASDALWQWIKAWLDFRPPANVLLLATVVNQPEADRDIPKLLATPARCRGLSIEPMLGPVDLAPFIGPVCDRGSAPGPGGYGGVMCTRCGGLRTQGGCPALDWVICGGESGPKARPMHPDWARSLRDQCAAAGVPFHFKQWGEWAPDEHFIRLPSSDDAIHEWEEGQTITGRSWRYGKKAAGRQLDGVEHNGFPGV